MKMVLDSNVVGTRQGRTVPLHIDETLLACKRTQSEWNRQRVHGYVGPVI
jgi:hypothetical protein